MGGRYSGSARTGRRRSRRYQPMAEINVTPFVDVMLVLLIIFMATAPLLSLGVKVDLPSSVAGAPVSESEPLTVTVDGTGGIFLGDSPIAPSDLGLAMSSLAAVSPERAIFVRGDRAVNYGVLMQVMSQIGSAGFTRISLITVPEAPK